MNVVPEQTVLAIDTSSSYLRLALRFGEDRVIKSAEEVERAHGQMIMRKIENLIESGGTTPGSIGGIAVCTGPGSFTGLRVGLAVTKGMAVALDIPVVGISIFEVAAYRLNSVDYPVTVLVHQRKAEYLAVTIERGSFELEQIQTLTTAHIVEWASRIRFATIGPVEPSLSDAAGTMLRSIDYDAADLIYLGESRLQQGGDQIDTLEPLYFGKSQAEIRFEQRQKKN